MFTKRIWRRFFQSNRQTQPTRLSLDQVLEFINTAPPFQKRAIKIRLLEEGAVTNPKKGLTPAFYNLSTRLLISSLVLPALIVAGKDLTIGGERIVEFNQLVDHAIELADQLIEEEGGTK